MKIKYGKGKTEYGPGISINLSGDEVAVAIDAYLVARRVCIRGPRTILVNGELIRRGRVYVDPSGFVVTQGKKISGRGAKIQREKEEVIRDLMDKIKKLSR